MKYFRVFVRKCYILNNRENLGNFDAKSDEGIFLGYSTNSRAYKVYNKRTKMVMESINFVIDDTILEKNVDEDGKGLTLKKNEDDGNMSQSDDGKRESLERSLNLLQQEGRLDQLKDLQVHSPL